jgi:hypothetical protein
VGEREVEKNSMGWNLFLCFCIRTPEIAKPEELVSKKNRSLWTAYLRMG